MDPLSPPDVGVLPQVLLALSGFVFLLLGVYLIAAHMRVFAKAGRPRWAVFVPVYNLVLLCEVAGVSRAWCIAALLPIVNLIGAPVAWTVIGVALAERFGRTTGFGLGLAFLPWIFFPVLAFGTSRYRPAPLCG